MTIEQNRCEIEMINLMQRHPQLEYLNERVYLPAAGVNGLPQEEGLRR